MIFWLLVKHSRNVRKLLKLSVNYLQEAFKALCELLEELGFTISPSKVVEPCQKLTFLGVEIAGPLNWACKIVYGRRTFLR